jgi:diguanylate cyclase (GGDEF)-like protein
MLDLDYFKLVNDRFGHTEDDRAPQAVAATLKVTAPENDIVARHGGEEFVVAALGLTEPESLMAAERLRAERSAAANLAVPRQPGRASTRSPHARSNCRWQRFGAQTKKGGFT